MRDLINLFDGRELFSSSLLFEMPVKIGPTDAYGALILDINNFSKIYRKKEIRPGFMCIESNDVVIYWYGDENNVMIATMLEKLPKVNAIMMTGKNQEYKNKPPYATELYVEILHTMNKNVLLVSDKFLSDDGLSIWRRLLGQNLKILVYDVREPENFKTLSNELDLMSFFDSNDKTYENYRYVLTEDISSVQLESDFRVYSYRKRNGIL